MLKKDLAVHDLGKVKKIIKICRHFPGTRKFNSLDLTAESVFPTEICFAEFPLWQYLFIYNENLQLRKWDRCWFGNLSEQFNSLKASANWIKLATFDQFIKKIWSMFRDSGYTVLLHVFDSLKRTGSKSHLFINQTTMAVSLKKSNRNIAKKERNYSNLCLTRNNRKLYNGYTFLNRDILDNICGQKNATSGGHCLQNETQLLCLWFTKHSWP